MSCARPTVFDCLRIALFNDNEHYKERGPREPSLQDRIPETNGKNYGCLIILRSYLQQYTWYSAFTRKKGKELSNDSE